MLPMIKFGEKSPCEVLTMANLSPFCTCTDTACPFHPSNHDKGCAPCIAKNLQLKEIPNCFYHSIDYPKPTKDYFYADFAALVEAAEKAGKL